MKDFPEMRLSILEVLKHITSELNSITDAKLASIQIRKYPFWNMINGPLADILTHIGQINMMKRSVKITPSKTRYFV